MNTVSALTSLPLSVTIIGAAFAIVIFNHYFSGKHRPHELVWGIAFLLFAIAAACQVLADLNGGWNPALARTYYLTGAILNVTLLGLGTAYLLLRRPIAHVALVLTVLLAVVSVYVLLTVPVDTSALGQSQQVAWKSVFEGNSGPSILAAIGSGLGSIVVIVGALWSGFAFLRRRTMKSRMIGVFLIAIGTFVVAFGGTLKGIFNNDHLLYPTMAVGVVIMFIGYLQTIRPAPATQGSVTQPAPGRTPTA